MPGRPVIQRKTRATIEVRRWRKDFRLLPRSGANLSQKNAGGRGERPDLQSSPMKRLVFPAKCACGFAPSLDNARQKLHRMFSHIVILWTDPKQPGAADEVLAAAEKYLRPIPGALTFHTGRMVSSPR